MKAELLKILKSELPQAEKVKAILRLDIKDMSEKKLNNYFRGYLQALRVVLNLLNEREGF